MRAVFVHPERCIGCRQCEFACAVAHSRSRDPVLALFEDPLPRTRIHVEPGPWLQSSFPNKCRHCDPAPCQQVCPTGAIGRAAAYDVVLVDAHRCIACAMCAMVCPVAALTFHALADDGMPARVAATKCDGCVDRLRDGLEPACVESCKTGALVYGELNELIQAERQRESREVVAAVNTIEPPALPVPQLLEGWRAWGQAADHVAEEVSRVHPS